MNPTPPPRRPYDSDTTDAEWPLYEKFFPPIRGLFGIFPPKTTTREVINAVRYIEKTGCPWRDLPHDLPHHSTVFRYFKLWTRQGLFELHRESLTIPAREHGGRPNPSEPTACVLDSQSVKTTEMGGEEVGKDVGKKISSGRKRHVLTDILGIVLCINVTSASVQDRDAGEMLLRKAKAKFPTLELVHVDSAYNGTFDGAVEELGMKMQRKESEKGNGFQVIKWRWVVERTHAWMNWSRRLSKDYEKTIESSEGWYNIAFARRMTRRLTGQTASFRDAV